MGWWYPTESRIGSFHSISGMKLEEHDSEDICFAPPASHIEKIQRKDLHGWMFDDSVIGLREDHHVNRPFPSFQNSLFQKEARCFQIVTGTLRNKGSQKREIKTCVI